MAGHRCPAGHDSEWDDYCSVCGATLSADPDTPVGGADGPGSGGAGGQCKNCGAAHRPEDVFCESCGFDFATETLPGGQETTPAAVHGAGDGGSGAPSASAATVVVSADRAWFEQAVASDELEFPTPVPETVSISLPGHKALIGRQSQSRGVFPEIDVAAATGDPAASSRHALIERTGDDTWTITDVGSTNGTMVGADLASAVELQPGVPVAFGPQTSAWIGAWTRVEFAS